MKQITIGTDEVGRGCLAGPVVAAAVILPENPGDWIDEVKDSKKLTAKKRERLAGIIQENCIYAIREMHNHVIEDMNILYASLYAMCVAADSVYRQSPEDKKPSLLLVDGNKTIPTSKEQTGWWDHPDVPQTAIIDGDVEFKVIGAASIIAKVYRDRMMVEYANRYPEYGFEKNKGYGSKFHREAIMQHGPCPIHRKTFSGVYQYIGKGVYNV